MKNTIITNKENYLSKKYYQFAILLFMMSDNGEMMSSGII
jgi:hypothetical protein